MKVATVAACPVFGGKLTSVDDSKAKAIKGVHQVVRLDDAVAVVADHMWAAKQGLGALDIHWDEGPNRKLGTADIVRQLAAASQRSARSRSRRATSRRLWRAPLGRSRRFTSCRSSPTPPSSRSTAPSMFAGTAVMSGWERRCHTSPRPLPPGDRPSS